MSQIHVRCPVCEGESIAFDVDKDGTVLRASSSDDLCECADVKNPAADNPVEDAMDDLYDLAQTKADADNA